MVGYRCYPFCRGVVNRWMPGFVFEVQVSVQLLYELVGVVRNFFESGVVLWCVVEALCQ